MTQILNSCQEILYECGTVVDTLNRYSFKESKKQAFTFLEDGKTQESTASLLFRLFLVHLNRGRAIAYWIMQL